MFSLNGQQSEFSKSVADILRRAGLPTTPKEENSFTVVLYSVDPYDSYHYLTGYAGLRQQEPMFGPRMRDSTHLLCPIDTPRGFRRREGIAIEGESCRATTIGPSDRPSAILWVSRRPGAKWNIWEKVYPELSVNLQSLFDKYVRPECPLYPELWYEERQARDNLRSAIGELDPWPRLTQVADVLSRALVQNFTRIVKGRAQIRVGIYLFTGEDWQLCGGTVESPFLPERIASETMAARRGFDLFLSDQSEVDQENAFEWVHRSTTPVLLKHPMSEVWDRRTQASDLSVPLDGGTCISPLRDPLDQSLTFGLIVVSVSETNYFGPALSFLTNRLSLSVSGYLARLLPIPGYPWWPNAHLLRGGAHVTDGQSQDNNTTRSSMSQRENCYSQVLKIARDLMPTGAQVELKPLAPGLTDSQVFQLKVCDKSKVIEIPRVLKVGSSEVIGDELFRYYKYVHNKIVGGHSRIDIARGYPKQKWNGGNSGTAAIVYTFVGPGENPQPWAEWARTSRLKEVEYGIELLMQQLACWHKRARLEQKGLPEITITREILDKQQARLRREPNAKRLQNPTIEDTLIMFHTLEGFILNQNNVQTCIVHGDPHCDNVFTLQDSHGRLKSIALIDWGKVQSGRHPLTDICILLADLMFRVCVDQPDVLSWGEELLNRWTDELRFSSVEASFVFAVHLLRMLAWRHRASQEPWLHGETRAIAWSWLKRRLKRDKLI